MDFFEAVQNRRSVRRYTIDPVPAQVVTRALDAALLAPNSSNMQTWEFYWVRHPEKKAQLVQACLGQGAAATAQELVVAVSNLKHWRRNNQEMLRRLNKHTLPKQAQDYYTKLIPFMYGWRSLSFFKFLMFHGVGIFRPMVRRPWSRRDVSEVSIKSVALACENFMLAITAQGYDTCPMEGFDECRVKKILGLRSGARVVMVISVGKRDPKGVWGQQIRFDRNWFVKEI